MRLSLLLKGKSHEITAENIWWAVDELAYTTDRAHFSPSVIGVLALAQLCMYADLNHPGRCPSIERASLDVVHALERWPPEALPPAKHVLAWVNTSLSIQYDEERIALGCVMDALNQCEAIRWDERLLTAQKLSCLQTVYAQATQAIKALQDREIEG